MAARDPRVAAPIAQAVKDFNEDLLLYGLSGSCLITEAKALGLLTANEVFADRTYLDDGSLTPRSQMHALIEDEDECIRQVIANGKTRNGDNGDRQPLSRLSPIRSAFMAMENTL